MKKPNLTIAAESMIRAQAVKLTKTQRTAVAAWADEVEARRLARGEDAEGARPRTFTVPVIAATGALLGHVAYNI
jgi:hypothetical protein